MQQIELEKAGGDGTPAPRPDPRRFRSDRVVAACAAAGIFAVMLIASAALIVNVAEREQHSVPSVPSVVVDLCDGTAIHFGTHGTDCRAMPVLTAPGALGPANTGGPTGGTDWEPALPGSNVWIPEEQISGRLVVHQPGSGIPPPDGYERIGQTPDGRILYWRPHDHPDGDPAGGQG